MRSRANSSFSRLRNFDPRTCSGGATSGDASKNLTRRHKGSTLEASGTFVLIRSTALWDNQHTPPSSRFPWTSATREEPIAKNALCSVPPSRCLPRRAQISHRLLSGPCRQAGRARRLLFGKAYGNAGAGDQCQRVAEPFAEARTVETQEHPHAWPDWNFTEAFPALPCVYRRSVIKDAKGLVRSYLSNRAHWEKSGKKKGRPGLPGGSNHPTLYEGAFSLELDGLDLRKTFVRRKRIHRAELEMGQLSRQVQPLRGSSGAPSLGGKSTVRSWSYANTQLNCTFRKPKRSGPRRSPRASSRPTL